MAARNPRLELGRRIEQYFLTQWLAESARATQELFAPKARNFIFQEFGKFRDQLAYVKRLSFVLLRSLFRLRAKFSKNGGEECELGARAAVYRGAAVLCGAEGSG